MKFPTYNSLKFTKEDGFLTDPMQYYFDEQSQALMKGLSDDGWTFPQVTATQLTAVQADMPNGTAWYVTTSNEIVFKVNGALRKLVTAAYP